MNVTYEHKKAMSLLAASGAAAIDEAPCFEEDPNAAVSSAATLLGLL